jgi:hypothetical protein
MTVELAGVASAPEVLSASLESRQVVGMSPLRARVENERLVLDEPITLPEGTIWLPTMRVMTSPRKNGMPCTKRSRRPGNPPKQVVFGLQGKFWKSCAAGSEPDCPNHA